MKIAVATSMMNSVRCEEELFQTVKDDRGSLDEGMMKGNIVSPTEEITPRIAILENSRVETSRPARRPRKVSKPPAMPKIGRDGDPGTVGIG